MLTTYQVLCSVALRHAYFTDGLLRSLAVRPTPATAERLRRAGLLLKARPDGFVLLYPVAGRDAVPFQAPAGLFPLQFGLMPLDAEFGNYSDLPLQPAPGQLYFMGRPAAVPAAEPAATRLHAGPVVGAADQLLVRPLQSRLDWPAAGSQAVSLCAYPSGEELARWPAPGAANPACAPLDLRPWGSGRYLLKAGKKTQDFYADDYLAAARPWGMLELAAPEGTSAGEASEFLINFAARPTFWQYQIMVRKGPPPTGLSISTGTKTQFLPVEPAAGAAFSFRAKQAISLAQRYDMAAYQLLSLPSAATSRPQTLCPALPHASPAALRFEQTPSGALAISEIFVTL